MFIISDNYKGLYIVHKITYDINRPKNNKGQKNII